MHGQNVEHAGTTQCGGAADGTEADEAQHVGVLGLPQPAVRAADEDGQRPDGVALLDERLDERPGLTGALADEHRVAGPDVGGEIDRHREGLDRPEPHERDLHRAPAAAASPQQPALSHAWRELHDRSREGGFVIHLILVRRDGANRWTLLGFVNPRSASVTLGPIEVVVLGFPGSRFTGEIRPRIIDLVKRGIVSVVDALVIKKDQAGVVTFTEMQQLMGDSELEALASAVSGRLDLLSDEDVDVFGAELEPGSSALAIVFEHTWMKPVRDAVAASGGVLIADIHVPAEVVDEVLAAAELV